ncbi:MAG: hypothetical protein NTX50_13765, partial [Candidatus Sumerlaeota bacterium]|nr:hypothetical protein [Candidatus Sumerlaeota bacterium]
MSTLFAMMIKGTRLVFAFAICGGIVVIPLPDARAEHQPQGAIIAVPTVHVYQIRADAVSYELTLDPPDDPRIKVEADLDEFSVTWYPTNTNGANASVDPINGPSTCLTASAASPADYIIGVAADVFFPGNIENDPKTITVPGQVELIAIDLQIWRDGENITDQLSHEMVGRRIYLEAVLVENSFETSFEWLIPEIIMDKWDVVYDYANKITYSHEPTMPHLNEQSVSFCWVDGGDGRDICVTAQVLEKELIAQTFFDVLKPSFDTI